MDEARKNLKSHNADESSLYLERKIDPRKTPRKVDSWIVAKMTSNESKEKKGSSCYSSIAVEHPEKPYSPNNSIINTIIIRNT